MSFLDRIQSRKQLAYIELDEKHHLAKIPLYRENADEAVIKYTSADKECGRINPEFANKSDIFVQIKTVGGDIIPTFVSFNLLKFDSNDYERYVKPRELEEKQALELWESKKDEYHFESTSDGLEL